MREWLSGGAPPCQGGGRGFDPRLALGKKNDTKSVSFFFSSPGRARKFDVYAPLRSAQSEVPRTSCAVSRFFIYSGSLDFTGFPLFLCGCRPAPTCTQSIYCIGYNAFSNNSVFPLLLPWSPKLPENIRK